MSFLSSHRPFNRRFSEREARLCHVESAPDRSALDPRKWLQEIAYGMTWASAENMASSLEAVARIPLGIVRGIYDVAKDRVGIDVQKLLRKAVHFVTTAPEAVIEWVTNIFDEQKDLTPEAMVNLMDLRLWILAFEGLNLNDPINDTEIDAQQDERNAAKDRIAEAGPKLTPRDYLESLTSVERRQRFATLTMSVIPADTQNNYAPIFGDPDPTKRRDAIKGKQDTLVSAMKEMYGFDDGKHADPEATNIAKDSLYQLLFINNTGTDKAHGASAGLKEEFLAHLDRRPGTMTREGIMAQFAAGDPEASLLLGAAKLDVLTQKDIDERILPKTEAQTTELLEESQKQRQLLEKTTRASQEDLRRSAETITERFQEMPGIAQLAIVIALIGGVYKFPKTSAGIAAFFLGKYVFLKDDNPIDSTGQNFFALVDKLRGVKAVGPIGPSKAVEQVGEQMLKFLPNEAHEDLSEAVTGFALLAGVDVGIIADNFEPTEDGRLGWLKAWEPPVKDALKASLKSRNMDTAAANRFFPSHDTREKGKDGKPLSTIDCSKHRNLCKTGDALASFFYRLGAHRVMKGAHTRKSLDMGTLGLIEQARTSSTSTGYYDDIKDGLEMVHPQQGKPVDIRTEYYEVILEGLEEGKARRGQSMEKVWKEIASVNVESTSGMPGVASGGEGLVAGGEEATARTEDALSDSVSRTSADDGKARSTDATAGRRTTTDDAAARTSDADGSRRVDTEGGALPRSSADTAKPFTADADGSRRSEDVDSSARTADADAKQVNSADEETTRRTTGADGVAPSSDAEGSRRSTEEDHSRRSGNSDSLRSHGSSEGSSRSQDSFTPNQRPSTESEAKTRSGETETQKRSESETSSGRPSDATNTRGTGSSSSNPRGSADADSRPSTSNESGKMRGEGFADSKAPDASQDITRPSTGNDAEPRS